MLEGVQVEELYVVLCRVLPTTTYQGVSYREPPTASDHGTTWMWLAWVPFLLVWISASSSSAKVPMGRLQCVSYAFTFLSDGSEVWSDDMVWEALREQTLAQIQAWIGPKGGEHCK